MHGVPGSSDFVPTLGSGGFRFKKIADSHWVNIRKQLQAGTGVFHDLAAQRPSTGAGAGGESFLLDMEVCRKTFETFDRDNSGYLDLDELAKLAEALWNTFHPEGPELDRESKLVRDYYGFFLGIMVWRIGYHLLTSRFLGGLFKIDVHLVGIHITEKLSSYPPRFLGGVMHI